MSSESPPPPKPKPGSLRDRIAAFEKPNAAAGKSAPPPLRPKPSGAVSWKPKPPSPPAEGTFNTAGGDGEGAVKSGSGSGGMSASDAKESIGRGGSLKDRMAALQGRGAFGAPAPVATSLGTGKKWVPPPKPPVEEEEERGEEAPKREGEEEKEKEKDEGEKEGGKDEEKEEGEADPEEEERQRRATIAARMARLGGARVGMSPPVFGAKPPIKKRPSEDAASVKSVDAASVKSADAISVKSDGPASPPTSPPIPVATLGAGANAASPPTSPPIPAATLGESAATDSEPSEKTGASDADAGAPISPPAASLSPPIDSLSPPAAPDSLSPLASAPAPADAPKHAPAPLAMPVPAAPRRAAPPRKKRGVSPMPAAREEAPPVEEPAPAKEDEAVEVPESASAPVTDKDEPAHSKEDEPAPAQEPLDVPAPAPAPAPIFAKDDSPSEAEEEFMTPAEERTAFVAGPATPALAAEPGVGVEPGGEPIKKEEEEEKEEEEKEEKEEEEPATPLAPVHPAPIVVQPVHSQAPAIVEPAAPPADAPTDARAPVPVVEPLREVEAGGEVEHEQEQEYEGEHEMEMEEEEDVVKTPFGAAPAAVPAQTPAPLSADVSEGDITSAVREGFLDHKEEDTIQHEPEPEAEAEEPEVDEEAEEAEEAARRQRVAERMARMGGVNPLGGARPGPPPPVRRATQEQASSHEEPEEQGLSQDLHGQHESQDQHGQHEEQEQEQEHEHEHEHEQEPEPEKTEEEEEADRKRRVMERMARMGGVNPFAGAPVRRGSSEAVPRKESKDSASARKDSAPARKTSEDVIDAAGEKEGEEHEREQDDEQEQYEREREDETAPHPAAHAVPSPPRAVPPPPPPVEEPEWEEEEQEEDTPPPPPPHRRSIVPPPPPVQTLEPEQYEDEQDEQEEQEEEEEVPPPPPPRVEHRRSIPAPPAHALKEEEEEAPPPPPPRVEHRRSIPPPPRAVPVPTPSPPEQVAEEEEQYEEEAAPPPPPPRTAHRRPPPTFRPNPPPPPPEDVAEEEYANEEEEEVVEVPPPLPRGRHSVYVASPPAVPSPPSRAAPAPVTALEDDYEQLETPEIGAFEHVTAPSPPSRRDRRSVPPPPPAADQEGAESPAAETMPEGRRPSAIQTGAKYRTSSMSLLSPASAAFEQKRQEVLDEEEGDPIDPAFHSPSRRTSAVDLQAVAAQQAEAQEDEHASPVEDPETVRRRTIAERMAKLGGIKFGAAPVPRARAPQASEDEQSGAAVADQDAEQAAQDEEEEERARRERIAAKLAGMGGQRIGMMPFGAGGLPPQQSKALGGSGAPPAPPARAVPPSRAPPPPQAQDVDSEHESLATNSEDGVRVEAEESEIEEIRHEDAQEEVPPPVPTRSGHRTSISSPPAQPPSEPSRRTSQPPVPAGRPPVPSTMPQSRRASGQIAAAPTSRKSSAETPPVSGSNHPRRASTFSKSQTQEFVMVDSDESPPPPPPPARPASRPPAPRTGPPPLPAGAAPPSDSVDDMASSSQWELPSIPTSSLDFGGGIDTSFIAFEGASSAVTPPKPAHPQSSQQPPVVRSTEVHYSADDLVAIWGRVGVHLCEAATQLYEKSKKSLVGDGTYTGFVHAALDEVPNAARSPPPAWGYLVYSQSAASVQKRLSDIMPGDIVVLFDAKLKGHKGLATYNQTVGAGEPLVGIVSEFEPKKSKIRVFQANQHVGHQTVEAASYRLEDLKSGIVKVYRVLEA